MVSVTSRPATPMRAAPVAARISTTGGSGAEMLRLKLVTKLCSWPRFTPRLESAVGLSTPWK